MEPTTTFDVLLRRARRAAGLTQEELAERAGLSARVISDIERGVIRAPRRDTLELLAVALNLNDDEQAQWERMRRRLARRAPQLASEPSSAVMDERPLLPEPLTQLIGRHREADQVIGLLQRPQTRLLTLTGPGGIGKTRLALAVASMARVDYSDGAVFVDLAPISEPGAVLPSIASALGLNESAGRTIRDALSHALRDKRALLVLDNFEQVVDAAGPVSELLGACPQLTILATSRVPLRIGGEQLYPVPPLSLPDVSGSIDANALLQSAAATLFVQRAEAVEPGFLVSDENAPAIAEICVRLDGLPLAIELAAARIAILSPHAILQRLDQRLQLLIDGPRDLPARQRTLRDTIQWSYDLLTSDEQTMLRQISVFVGGWTLEAAEAVVENSGPTHIDILGSLAALSMKSLIRVVADDDDQPRFGMLESIREFALAELGRGNESDAIRDRHASYFLLLAEASSSHVDGSDEREWVERMEREHDNLRAAIAWLRERNDIARGLRLVGALGHFWFTRGHLSEGRSHIQSFLGLPGAGTRTAARATALVNDAWLAAWQDAFAESFEASEEALAIWRELEDQAEIPGALLILGIAASLLGDLDFAHRTWLECADLAQVVGDRANQARALNNLGVMASREGRVKEAIELFQESLAASEEAGSATTVALALSNLGDELIIDGDTTHGEHLIRKSLQMSHALGSIWGMEMSLLMLAGTAHRQGQPARATRLRAAADTLNRHLRSLTDPFNLADEDPELAALRAALGDEFQTHWDQGAALTMDEAVAEALGDDMDAESASSR